MKIREVKLGDMFAKQCFPDGNENEQWEVGYVYDIYGGEVKINWASSYQEWYSFKELKNFKKLYYSCIEEFHKAVLENIEEAKSRCIYRNCTEEETEEFNKILEELMRDEE